MKRDFEILYDRYLDKRKEWGKLLEQISNTISITTSKPKKFEGKDFCERELYEITAKYQGKVYRVSFSCDKKEIPYQKVHEKLISIIMDDICSRNYIENPPIFDFEI